MPNASLISFLKLFPAGRNRNMMERGDWVELIIYQRRDFYLQSREETVLLSISKKDWTTSEIFSFHAHRRSRRRVRRAQFFVRVLFYFHFLFSVQYRWVDRKRLLQVWGMHSTSTLIESISYEKIEENEREEMNEYALTRLGIYCTCMSIQGFFSAYNMMRSCWLPLKSQLNNVYVRVSCKGVQRSTQWVRGEGFSKNKRKYGGEKLL